MPSDDLSIQSESCSIVLSSMVLSLALAVLYNTLSVLVILLVQGKYICPGTKNFQRLRLSSLISVPFLSQALLLVCVLFRAELPSGWLHMIAGRPAWHDMRQILHIYFLVHRLLLVVLRPELRAT